MKKLILLLVVFMFPLISCSKVTYLDIPFENTYCFGDGINDLEMLEAVNHPVIMKNCDPQLKTKGFEETDDQKKIIKEKRNSTK